MNVTIRTGILTSARVDKLSYGAELFYRRLLSAVNGKGVIDATTSILRASCFPLRIDSVSNAQVEEWVNECVAADLVQIDDDGKLTVLRFIHRGHDDVPDKERERTPAGDFDAFWNAYPRKVGKGDARRAWDALRHRPDLETLLLAIEKRRGSEQWKKEGGQYIPHPSTWLRQHRWLDDETATAREYQSDIQLVVR